jgi:hypothetical protein
MLAERSTLLLPRGKDGRWVRHPRCETRRRRRTAGQHREADHMPNVAQPGQHLAAMSDRDFSVLGGHPEGGVYR